MVAPSGEGAVRCMKMAMRYLDRPVDYLNTHGTSTPVGDLKEMEAVRAVFGAKPPLDLQHQVADRPFARRRRRAGSDLFAADDEQQLRLRERAISRNSIPAFEDLPILRQREDRELNCVLSNSFGFGGTNATLAFTKLAA